MNRLALLLLSAGLLLASLGGCGKGPEHAVTAASGPGKPVFTFAGLSDHNHLDPQRMSWLHDIRIADCLFDPLVRYSLPTFALEPAVASRWEVSPDLLTYTFHLRPEARWSNGDPVTAHDFVYAWRRAMTPDLAANYKVLFSCVRGADDFYEFRDRQLKDVSGGKLDPQQAWKDALTQFDKTVGLATPDDHTLIVTLIRPTPYFLQLCAFATLYPVHARSVEALTKIDPATGMLSEDSKYWSDPDELVCNGPYLLQRHRFKIDMTLAPNPHYWNAAAVANGGIVEKFIADPQTQLLAYDRGEVDWLPDIPTSTSLAADLIAQNRPDVHVIPAAGTYFYSFNCQPKLADGSKNPLADARVRRALSMGIDRKTIVDQVTRLHQPVALTFTPPGAIEGYSPPTDAGVSFDVEGARKLLAEAGYPNGRGLAGLSILYNSEGGHQNIAQQIKRDWQEKLGVDVSLESVETRQFGERLNNRQYTIARSSWFGDYRDPTTFLDKFISDNSNNNSAWVSPEYDAALRRAAGEVDPAKRFDLLRQAEAIMLRQQPIAPIFQYLDLYLYDPHKVAGLEPNAWKYRRLDQVVVHR